MNQAEELEGSVVDALESSERAREQRKLTSIPETLPDRLTELLQRIQKERKRPLFILVAENIDDRICRDVYTWRNELREVGKGGDLDVLIHSPGGELHACYVLARLLSRYVRSWGALVPSEATSGATLVCLGSSNVVMSDLARLGPLDPQVISKRREKFFAHERQSPLEAFQAMKYLREFSLTALDIFMGFLLERGVNPTLALKTSSELATQLVRTPLEKIEPYDLGAFALDNELAKGCCERILRSTGPDRRTQQNVKPESLVELYPTHFFVIDREEAGNIGFEVSPPSREIEPLFEELVTYLEEVQKLIGLLPAA